MPEWKSEVVNAFAVLNLDHATANQADAAKAYKVQAMRHHPDKNPGDPSATAVFQKIGAAYEVILRHFENPTRSYVTEAYDDDDGFGVDPDDMAAFFTFMFEEIITGTYRRGRYRSGRRGGGGPQFFFVPPPGLFGGYSPSYSYSPNSYSSESYSSRQLKQEDSYANEENQANKKAEYEKRLREFELEIAAEQREIQKQAMEKSKDLNRRATAYQQAFQAARAGKAATVVRLVQEYNLDVNSPEKMQRANAKTKQTNYQTLLHAACRCSDESLIVFLLDKGANTEALNDAKLQPFHVAIAHNNFSVVKFFLLRRVRGKTTPGCHPSKTAPDGRSPLQIALAGGNPEMVTLMSKEATVHDVERCWLLPEAALFKDILSTKKGFVDPELRRQEAEQKAAEIAERARVNKERADKALAEKLARQREQEVIEEQRRLEAEFARMKKEADDAAREKRELKARQEMEAEEAARQMIELEARQKREAEETARRKIELQERQEKEAKEAVRRKLELEARQKREAEVARRRAEHETRLHAEAEAVKQATDARNKAEAQARQLAEEQERARCRADEEARLKNAAKAEAKRLQREAEAAAVRQDAEAEAKRQAAYQAEALRIAAAENARLQQVATQEAERTRRAAAEQQRLEAKRAETMRRLQGQAEENRRLAAAKETLVDVASVNAVRPPQSKTPVAAQKLASEEAPDALVSQFLERRKLGKMPKKHDKHEVQDLRQLSPEVLQKRAAQSARDRARIAEEREKRRQQLVDAQARQRPETPESMQGRDFPPTPVSMPSPSQRRMSPPLVPHHTRPNVPARMMDPVGVVMLGPEDIQTGAIADDLFAVEGPKVVSEMPFRGRGRGFRGRGRGRGRV
ncbi:hypothetical protein C8R46DRAFT_1062817 [Mycena filopes]|nr:hypothetical protein C8R46DRAFT_1062817 [Mycena filopes]